MPEKNQGRSFFFQASSFQLLKLENLLRCSFFTFSYNRSSSMNYFIYTSHHTSNTSLNWLPVRSHNTSETKLKTESIIFKILSSISNQSKKLVQHIDITVRYTITKSLQKEHTSPVHTLSLSRNTGDKGSLSQERSAAWKIKSLHASYNPQPQNIQ